MSIPLGLEALVRHLGQVRALRLARGLTRGAIAERGRAAFLEARAA